MHQLTLQLTTRAPLLIPVRHGDANIVATQTFLPGSSILGIFAAAYLKNNSIPPMQAGYDDDFYRIFLKGDLIFRNAYLFFKDEHNTPRRFEPCPLSIQQEKFHATTYDLLIDDDEDDDEKEMDQPSPLTSHYSIDAQILYQKNVVVTEQSHHREDSEKRIPEQGAMFNYEAIAPDQTFECDIIGRKEDLEMILDMKGISFNAQMGRSKTAEYGGNLTCTFQQDSPEPVTIEPDEYENTLILNLVSDTIILNHYGYSTLDIQDLQPYLQGAQIIRSFLKPSYAEQFMGIWQMNTPSENCLKAGSSFLLDISGLDVATRETLYTLEILGIGERCHEGFGQCKFSVCPDEREAFTEISVNAPDPPKPNDIKRQTSKVVKKVIFDLMKHTGRTLAVRDLEEFRSLPSNALIGTLRNICLRQGSGALQEKIRSMKDTAISQLRRCKNSSTRLFDFLQENRNMAKRIINHRDYDNVRKLCTDTGYEPENDPELEEYLSDSYYNIFFKMMNKKSQ